MSIFFQTGSFILGLIVGSFLNAVIYRLKHSQSLFGFSACPRCRHRLMPKDLVPVFSFIFLGGECRYCGAKISRQYPAVELACGLVFFLTARHLLGPGPMAAVSAQSLSLLFFNFIFVALLLTIFTFDFRYYLIPDLPVFFGVAAALIYRWVSPDLGVINGLWGMILVAGFFGSLFLASRGAWIGLGDVKLGVFLGLLLGLKLSAVMLAGAYFSGALVGVGLVLLGRKTMKGVLPFGTFLCASAFSALLWGEPILKWYLSFF